MSMTTAVSSDGTQSWTAYASCAGAVARAAGADAMFVQGAAQREARQICISCPVRMACLVEALETGMEFGVWGGLTERERRAMRRQAGPGVEWRERLANDLELRERFAQERVRQQLTGPAPVADLPPARGRSRPRTP